MKDLANEELVNIAGSTVIGTPSGLKAKQAQAELNKRLMDSIGGLKNTIDENNKATHKYNDVILDLTIAMALLAVLQVIIAALANNFSWPLRIGLAIAPVMVLVMAVRNKNNK